MSICSICKDVINDRDPYKTIKINCGHAFHDQCLQAWIDRGENNQFLCGNMSTMSRMVLQRR